MVKYVEYDAFDELGQHITPINTLQNMTKLASSYSPELMRVISNMMRRPDRYYVVINALGSYEVWGCNRNGDAFPRSGLTHKSLRTDMGTDNDYGYKTFEYYAKLYKHHVNKDPNRSFGEVVFSHWNQAIDRVELIVGVDIVKGKDIIDALEKGDQVSVSMGCKVKYDRCSICGHKAKTRIQYCKHLKNHMREIINDQTALQWSKELGINIIPGMQVFAYNDKPRFFDISKVYIGADRTSYILGKAASDGSVILSADIADAYGVTDSDIDKVSFLGKSGEMDKEVGGAQSNEDTDGRVIRINKARAISKALDEKMSDSISREPFMENNLIDRMAPLPLSTIFSTMFGLGIHPKPAEFQRIILVKMGRKPFADQLENNGVIFDQYSNNGEIIEIPGIGINNFSTPLAKVLYPILGQRSCIPNLLNQRMMIVKTASDDNIAHLLEPVTVFDKAKENSILGLVGLAALYAGLKAKAYGIGPKMMVKTVVEDPFSRAIVGGGVLYKIFQHIDRHGQPSILSVPVNEYEGLLGNTNLSGHMKLSSLHDAIITPMSYIKNSYTQHGLYPHKKYSNEIEKNASILSDDYIRKEVEDIKNSLHLIIQ